MSLKKAFFTMKVYSYNFLSLIKTNALLMSKILPIFFVAISFVTFSQSTYVPDDNLEAYFESAYPAADNGIANDDSVLTAGIEAIPTLYLNGSSYLIYDYTGLEDCTQLSTLVIQNQQTDVIDLGDINNNSISLTVWSNNLLENLFLPEGELSIDIRLNPLLKNVYFDNSNELNNVTFLQNNSIQTIDFSMTSSVNSGSSLSISLNPSLECVNISNGSCTFWLSVSIGGSSLTCVQVDDPTYSNTAWGDPTAVGYYFSTNCGCGNVGLQNETVNNKKELIGIYDMLGRKCQFQPNKVLVYLYSDGSMKRVFKTE